MMQNRENSLPHNIGYERSVLSLLIDPETRPDDRAEVFDSLKSSDFYDLRHQELFKACLRLDHEKKPIDFVTVVNAIESKIDNAGSFVSLLVDELPATSIEHYSEVIRNFSTARMAIQNLSKWLNDIRSLKGDHVNNIGDLLDELQRDILQIDSRGRIKFNEPSSLLSEAIEEYKSLNQRTRDVLIKTGFHGLDQIINIRGSKLIIIAARPGVGKSSFLTSASRNMLRNGIKTAIFELEMDSQDITNRWISQEANINLMLLTYGSGPGPEDWKRIMEAGEVIYEWPALVDDEGGPTIHELKRRIRIVKKQGAQCIFIDQLSQIRGEGKTEYERNTFIVQELSKLKKEIRIPIFLLAQINRKQDESGSKKPALHMLKTTGSLEEEADQVLLIDRPYAYTKEPCDKNLAYIEVAKNRHGPTGEIELLWFGSKAMFNNPPLGKSNR